MSKPKRQAITDLEDFAARGVAAQAAVDTAIHDIDVVDLTAPPVVIDKERENGKTHVQVVDETGHVHFEATHGVEGLTPAQRVEYRAALDTAQKVNAEERAKVATPTTTTTKRESGRGRGRPTNTEDDAKYGPLRHVESVTRTIGKRSVVRFQVCGHESTVKLNSKSGRCRTCKNAALGKTGRQRAMTTEKIETKIEKPKRTPVTESVEEKTVKAKTKARISPQRKPAKKPVAAKKSAVKKRAAKAGKKGKR